MTRDGEKKRYYGKETNSNLLFRLRFANDEKLPSFFVKSPYCFLRDNKDSKNLQSVDSEDLTFFETHQKQYVKKLKSAESATGYVSLTKMQLR